MAADATDLRTIFEVIHGFLPEGGESLVRECGSLYGFEAIKSDGNTVTFTLDLRNGSGNVAVGIQGRPQAVFVGKETDIIDLFTGRATFDVLVPSRRLKIKGNLGKAMKLRVGMLPKMTAQNIAKYRKSRL